MPKRKYTRTKPLTPAIERFHQSYTVNEITGCWEWEKSRRTTGYGQFSVRQCNPKLAHRWLWEHLYGEIDNRWLFVCHHCDNPCCVNPDHLFLGTPKDNMQDMIRKERQSKPRNLTSGQIGSKHHSAKLTEFQIPTIRMLRLKGMSFRKIAKIYEVNNRSIEHICKRTGWAHVP